MSTSLYGSAEDWIRSNFPPVPPKPEPQLEPRVTANDLGCGELGSDIAVFPLYLWLVVDPKGSWDDIRECVIVAADESAAIAAFHITPMYEKQVRKRLFAVRVGIALPGATPGAVLCTDILEA